MLTAELKSLISADIDPNTYWPEPENIFSFHIEAVIGVSGNEGGDIFGFHVCSPAYLLSRYSGADIVVARTMLIAIEYDFDRIKKKLEHICQSTTGDNWEQIANKLARQSHWEYEGYEK